MLGYGGARELFEAIRADVLEMAGLERSIEDIETQAGPHGQMTGSIGGSGAHDGMRGIDRLVDSGLREELERMRAKVNPEIERATDVLYGRSGRGGVARARSTADADILCGYYLQGMSWPQVAAAHADSDKTSPNIWCRMRAKRALEFIDRVGAPTLADS